MSGGSWDYVYRHIEEAADRLEYESCPFRRAFGKRMRLMAKAMHDIEWVDSGDYCEGDEIAAIEAAIGENYRALALDEIRAEILTAIKRAEELGLVPPTVK